MWQYIGLLNLIFGAIVLAWLLTKNPRFSIKRLPLSSLASDKKTGWVFKILLFVFSLNQTFFAIIIAEKLITKPALIMGLFIFSGLMLMVSSIFSLKEHDKIHNYSARVSLFLVWLGVIFLAINFLAINFSVGFFLLITAILIVPIYFLRNRMAGGLFELPLILIITAWNTVLSVYLLV